jgi:cell division septation protein DedD
MEVEDEDSILERLFFKKYGRALPEKEKEKDDVDQIKFVIDLTDESDEMEVATPIVVVKTEPIEAPENVANVTNADKVAADRKERRELVKARKALIAFGKTLRKSNIIPEKEVPTSENVVADSNVSADTSVNTVKTAEQIEMEADQKEFVAEFGDVPLDEFDSTGSEFRLYGPEDVLPSDDEDAMIDDV